jgi:RHS repeat-associated protein
MTDVNGVVVWTASYTPFGVAVINEDPDGDGILVNNSFRLPGQYYDAETGLNYNYFRTYDPLVGRYTQSDPIGLRGGLNVFGYVNGDPVNSVDINGLFVLSANLYLGGLGGGISIGQNPNGSWFFAINVGAGFGGGLTFNADATSPGYDICLKAGVGVSAGVGVALGPLSTSYGAQVGLGSAPDASIIYTEQGPGKGLSSGKGARIGGGVGFQSFWVF